MLFQWIFDQNFMNNQLYGGYFEVGDAMMPRIAELREKINKKCTLVQKLPIKVLSLNLFLVSMYPILKFVGKFFKTP